MVSEQERSMEILLVEDNFGDILLTKEAFIEGNVSTNLNVVSNGNDAWNYLKKTGDFENAKTPDLVLLDLNLPRKNGREILQEIKADSALKHIPVIILTTSDSIEDIRSCYQLDANCFITKPVDFNQFVNIVKQIEHFWFNIVRLPSSAN